MTDFILSALVIGIGATFLMDAWALILERAFRIPRANWGLIGRWFRHVGAGRVLHDDIAQSPAYPHERLTGWLGHYAIGIVYAGILLAMVGQDWLDNPTLLPPLLVGLVTVGAGWFVLQPAIGAGIAASRLGNPWRARLFNIIGHVIFGLGLYISAFMVS